jgi:hypothetical protein
MINGLGFLDVGLMMINKVSEVGRHAFSPASWSDVRGIHPWPVSTVGIPLLQGITGILIRD